MSDVVWIGLGDKHLYAKTEGYRDVGQVNEALNGEGFVAMTTYGNEALKTKRVQTLEEGKQWVLDQLAIRRLRGQHTRTV